VHLLGISASEIGVPLTAAMVNRHRLEVVECSTAEAAELVVSTADPELLALVPDVNLEGAMTGVELAEFAVERFLLLTVVVLSGRPAPRLPGKTRFFAKPCPPQELLAAILHQPPIERLAIFAIDDRDWNHQWRTALSCAHHAKES